MIKTAVNRSLKGVILDTRDTAAVELAKHYAGIIDDDEEHLQTWRYGARLLDVLRELGMTPRVRATVLHAGRKDKDDGPDESASELDRLRSRRQHRAAS